MVHGNLQVDNIGLTEKRWKVQTIIVAKIFDFSRTVKVGEKVLHAESVIKSPNARPSQLETVTSTTQDDMVKFAQI